MFSLYVLYIYKTILKVLNLKILIYFSSFLDLILNVTVLCA